MSSGSPRKPTRAPAAEAVAPAATAPEPAPATATTPPPAATLEESLLEKIIAAGKLARDDEQRGLARDLIGEFVDQVVSGDMKIANDTQAMLNDRIGQIDVLISKQLNEVMHHDDFQRLEASWRGLHYFTHETETSTQLKIRVLNATKRELYKNMEHAVEFDQSALFKKVYEEEFGTFGGAPFGALVGDYYFSRHPEDMALLEKLSNVAAAAHAPFISGAAPQLFNWDDFTEMSGPRDLSKIFESPEYVKWRAFRDSEDSRYVGLCLPHILMRLPYGQETAPTESFNFEEDVDGTDHSKYLWGNAAYAFACRLTESFARHHWCAAIRGVEGGGLVSGLPSHTFKTDAGDVALKCPTELAITDRREKELADTGFIPLVHCKGTDYAAFFTAQSCQRAKSWSTDAANANARLSTQLPYIMATSRIAHYLKAMMRDKTGAFTNQEQIQKFLNTWISLHVTTDDSASQEAKAARPLREARVDVLEVPGKPGAFKAVAFLRPHFQLDELTISLRLVAQLPEPIGKG